MADRLGSYDAAFFTTGALLIVGASITFLLKFTMKLTSAPRSQEQMSPEEEEILVVEVVTVV